MMGYVKKSMVTIIRAYMMYKPLRIFTIIALIPFLIGFGIGIRYIVYMTIGEGDGHMQSLILGSTLMMMGFMTFVIGLQADIIARNRIILEDVQYRVRKLDYDGVKKNEDDK
jgi:hypothetical protein